MSITSLAGGIAPRAPTLRTDKTMSEMIETETPKKKTKTASYLLRLDDDEQLKHGDINADNNGFPNKAAFIRHECFYDPEKGKPKYKPRRFSLSQEDAQTFYAVAKQLAPIGNNLNQYTRAKNTEIERGESPDPIIDQKVIKASEDVSHLMNILLKIVGNT